LATPPVRRLAKEMGVDIRTVEGSGPGGRVLREDLEHLLTSPVKQGSRRRAGPDVSPGQSTPLWELAGDQRTPLIGFRKYISEKMVEAKYLVPHFAYFDSCDCSRMITMRRRVKAEADAHGVKLTYMAFFIRALSLALKEQPVFNSSVDLDTNEHVIHQVHNIGIATKSKDGLIVPVLKNVQDMGFHDVIRAYDALRRKAVSDTLVSSDMKEATITISNFGTEGGKWATPIINYPEVCILGLAKIEKQPVVKGQQVVAQDRLNLSWCGDHRVLDGDKMAKFSNTFIRLIENPALLL
jgi:pyruvate dehydrogenase E2 component (dihydrolipoamide acetyltransferase)/2-oxoisovalerate dehydrogenase E2 component (dihydrolipoyl transacylase)